MRTLSNREKRTVRIGAVLVGAYLLVFGGVQTWKFLERKRADYAQVVREAENLGREIRAYQSKADSTKKLMEAFKLDPARLSRMTTVGEASAAIQKTAAAGGIQLGPVRESPARPSNKELATLQLEGTGPVPAVTALLSRLESVGFPLVIETVQLTPAPMGPAMVKVSLTIVILDFDQWKKEVPRA